MDRSTVYRQLKQLETLRLISCMRTGGRTIYVVLPVPPPPREAASTPLFDAVEAKSDNGHSTWPPVASARFSCVDEIESQDRDPSVAAVQPPVAQPQQVGRTRENRNKEEQDSSNKTQERDFLNKNSEQENAEVREATQRILNRFPDTPMDAAFTAAEIECRWSGLSAQGVAEKIWDRVIQADRAHVPRERFWDEYLSRWLGEWILGKVNLPTTHNLVDTVAKALRAEAKDRELGLRETSQFIVTAATNDRNRGTTIDRFYFENCKWRSNARASKAEQRKLDNLEVNARVKQRLREKFGAS